MMSPMTMEAAAAGVEESLSLAKASDEVERLLKSPASTRDEWKRVVAALILMHKNKASKVGPKSLYLAGRASLGLYKRSGKIEDLDDAIKYLTDAAWINRRSPQALAALRELKKAQGLKRKALGAVKVRASSPVSPRALKPLSVPPPVMTTQVMPVDHSFAGRPKVGTEVTTAKAGNRVALSRRPLRSVGNPYFLPVQRPGVVTAPDTRRAALPPATMTDAIPAAQKRAVAGSKEKVIVIDPGHGGKDPGAVSADGKLREKDLALEMAQRLKDRLEKTAPGIRVVLTRNDDSFLTLPQRAALANSLDADLFVSIHGNGSDDSRAKGVETYYLSKASSRGAMRVAARENGIPLARMSDLEATLVDLMVSSKTKESENLANAVHGALVNRLLKRDPAVRDRGVKRAPFYVLLGAKMPAILIECAFVSNGRERVKLNSDNHLDHIADGITEGTAKYLKSLEGNS